MAFFTCMWCMYTYWFLYISPSLHLWNKAKMIMVNDLLGYNIEYDLQIFFIGDVCSHAHQGDLWLTSFLIASLSSLAFRVTLHCVKTLSAWLPFLFCEMAWELLVFFFEGLLELTVSPFGPGHFSVQVWFCLNYWDLFRCL